VCEFVGQQGLAARRSRLKRTLGEEDFAAPRKGRRADASNCPRCGGIVVDGNVAEILPELRREAFFHAAGQAVSGREVSCGGLDWALCGLRERRADLVSTLSQRVFGWDGRRFRRAYGDAGEVPMQARCSGVC